MNDTEFYDSIKTFRSSSNATKDHVTNFLEGDTLHKALLAHNYNLSVYRNTIQKKQVKQFEKNVNPQLLLIHCHPYLDLVLSTTTWPEGLKNKNELAFRVYKELSRLLQRFNDLRSRSNKKYLLEPDAFGKKVDAILQRIDPENQPVPKKELTKKIAEIEKKIVNDQTVKEITEAVQKELGTSSLPGKAVAEEKFTKLEKRVEKLESDSPLTKVENLSKENMEKLTSKVFPNLEVKVNEMITKNSKVNDLEKTVNKLSTTVTNNLTQKISEMVTAKLTESTTNNEVTKLLKKLTETKKKLEKNILQIDKELQELEEKKNTKVTESGKSLQQLGVLEKKFEDTKKQLQSKIKDLEKVSSIPEDIITLINNINNLKEKDLQSKIQEIQRLNLQDAKQQVVQKVVEKLLSDENFKDSIKTSISVHASKHESSNSMTNIISLGNVYFNYKELQKDLENIGYYSNNVQILEGERKLKITLSDITLVISCKNDIADSIEFQRLENDTNRAVTLCVLQSDFNINEDITNIIQTITEKIHYGTAFHYAKSIKCLKKYVKVFGDFYNDIRGGDKYSLEIKNRTSTVEAPEISFKEDNVTFTFVLNDRNKIDKFLIIDNQSNETTNVYDTFKSNKDWCEYFNQFFSEKYKKLSVSTKINLQQWITKIEKQLRKVQKISISNQKIQGENNYCFEIEKFGKISKNINEYIFQSVNHKIVINDETIYLQGYEIKEMKRNSNKSTMTEVNLWGKDQKITLDEIYTTDQNKKNFKIITDRLREYIDSFNFSGVFLGNGNSDEYNNNKLVKATKYEDSKYEGGSAGLILKTNKENKITTKDIKQKDLTLTNGLLYYSDTDSMIDTQNDTQFELSEAYNEYHSNITIQNKPKLYIRRYLTNQSEMTSKYKYIYFISPQKITHTLETINQSYLSGGYQVYREGLDRLIRGGLTPQRAHGTLVAERIETYLKPKIPSKQRRRAVRMALMDDPRADPTVKQAVLQSTTFPRRIRSLLAPLHQQFEAYQQHQQA